MTKFEVALSTLFVGFMLGQATDFMKYKWAINRKKKALKTEIHDMVEDFSIKMERLRQVATVVDDNHFGAPVPGKINTIIFDKYIAEVAPFFNSVERKSIYLIYTHAAYYCDELTSGDRSNATSAKNSIFILYAQSKFGYESTLFFKKHRGAKLLKDDQKKIDEINADIEKFALDYGITSSEL